MGAHSLSEIEEEALEALREAGLLSDGLEFHVALVHMSREVHDVIARILEKHPGRRRVYLCLHSGEKKPTRLELVQRASTQCQEPMSQFLGRYAV